MNVYVLLNRISAYLHDSLEERSLKAPRAVREESTVMGPVGLGTKNDCAGGTSSNLPVIPLVTVSECPLKPPPTEG
jgi:hypothetical protein